MDSRASCRDCSRNAHIIILGTTHKIVRGNGRGDSNRGRHGVDPHRPRRTLRALVARHVYSSRREVVIPIGHGAARIGPVAVAIRRDLTDKTTTPVDPDRGVRLGRTAERRRIVARMIIRGGTTRILRHPGDYRRRGSRRVDGHFQRCGGIARRIPTRRGCNCVELVGSVRKN